MKDNQNIFKSGDKKSKANTNEISSYVWTSLSLRSDKSICLILDK